jgi:cytochrome c-type biogenesis protein CcmH
MKRLIHLMLLGLFLALPTASLALDGNEMFDDPAKEQRARDIGRQLRCMVCQNQSIFDSNAGLAKDLRVLVRERMEAGDSDSEVLHYISDRFGEYVLLEPRWSGKNAVLWLTPAVGLLLAIATAIAYLRGRSRRSAPVHLDASARAEAKALLGEKSE